MRRAYNRRPQHQAPGIAADLKILFRLSNLTGQPGRDAMPTFTAANFEITQAVPEPSTAVMLATAGVLLAARLARRRTRKGN